MCCGNTRTTSGAAPSRFAFCSKLSAPSPRLLCASPRRASLRFSLFCLARGYDSTRVSRITSRERWKKQCLLGSPEALKLDFDNVFGALAFKADLFLGGFPADCHSHRQRAFRIYARGERAHDLDWGGQCRWHCKFFGTDGCLVVGLVGLVRVACHARTFDSPSSSEGFDGTNEDRDNTHEGGAIGAGAFSTTCGASARRSTRAKPGLLKCATARKCSPKAVPMKGFSVNAS
jgi:hypothetical protein